MAPAHEIAPGIFLANVSIAEYDVRGALVLGETHALVWDTLTHPRDVAAFVPLIGRRRLVIVYSHADWDHVWGTAGLPLVGASIVGHRTCLARFGDDVPATLAEKRVAEPGVWADVVLVPPGRVFDRDGHFDLGGVTMTVRHLPGHTADCSVGFVPEHGVLLAGDTVETPCPMVPAAAPLHAWIDELRRWAADPRVRTVVPAHGNVGGPEILTQNIDYLRGLLDGRPVDPPGPLSAFYEETHRANLLWRPA